MGMYTQFHFASDLKEDTPEEVIDTLRYMTDPSSERPATLPAHPFFECSRWDMLFTMDSYYFDYKTHCDFYYDDIAQSFYLSVTSNIKNYSDEIEKFVQWITPYLNKFEGDFLGYSRYEEEEEPIIIYFKE